MASDIYAVPARRSVQEVFSQPIQVDKVPRGVRIPSQQAMERFFDAEQSRLTNDWSSAYKHIDQMIFNQGDILMARARSLEQSNPTVRGFLGRTTRKVIGANGFGLIPKPTRQNSEEIDLDAKRKISAWFTLWAKSRQVAVDGRDTWRSFLKLAMRRFLVDGEVFIRRYPGYSGNETGVAWKILQAEQIDRSYNREPTNGNNRIKQGVELDAYDRPVAYHTLPKSYATSYSGQQENRIRIEAENMIHWYLRELPNQVRGFTYLCSTMLRSRMLDAFEFASLVNARVSASKMGFFKKGPEYAGQNDEELYPVNSVEPGQFEELPVGMDFVPFDPSPPTDTLDSFEKWSLRSIASGLGASYNSVSNDTEGLSFSAHKHIELDERSLWRDFQADLAENICSPVYTEAFRFALLTQQVRLPLSGFDRFRLHGWELPSWQWSDPTKMSKYYRDLLELELISKKQAAAELGINYEDTLQALSEEPDPAPAE